MPGLKVKEKSLYGYIINEMKDLLSTVLRTRGNHSK